MKKKVKQKHLLGELNKVVTHNIVFFYPFPPSMPQYLTLSYKHISINKLYWESGGIISDMHQYPFGCIVIVCQYNAIRAS